MNAIEIRGLTRRFGARTAVDSLTLDIGQGEIFALLGLNGAGKTTTIRMLCGLLPPDGGDALVCGESVVRAPREVKRRINISPQETAVASRLSVAENLELAARLYGADRAQARRRAGEMMERFRLSDRARDRAKTLSGGMQRRLSIAMACISDPEVLFLDEPTLGLDVRARRELWELIRELGERSTVVLTTHYLEEVAALAGHIAVMSAGKLRAAGTQAEILRTAGRETLEDAFLALTETEGEA